MSSSTINSLISRFDLLKAFRDFPLSAVFAVIATFAAIFYIDFNDNETLMRISAAGYLGFLSAIVVEVYLQKNKGKWLLVLPFVIFTIWYLYIPLVIDELPEYEQMRRVIRYMASALILHLLISVIPYLRSSSEEDLWEYNRHLFLGIFESVLFTAIIFIGLSLAIVALDRLFGLDVDGEWYARLFIFLAGIFNSLYFLGKYPSSDYDAQVEEPFSGYKVFTEYILIAITSIYLLLLYAYAGKIMMEGELPEGWIGYLTIFFSVIGILSWLLNYFNPHFSSHKWTHFFTQHFFKFLTLPVIMLFVAIYSRVNEYGITEPRYIVAAIAIWLAILVIMYGWLKKPPIKYIPISLAVVAAFCAFGGPLDMFDVSLKNQSDRLHSLLMDHKVLEADHFNIETLEKLDNAVKFQIKEAISAVGDRSDLQIINDWTDSDLLEGYEDEEGSRSNYLIRKLKLEKSYNTVVNDYDYFNLNTSLRYDIDVREYDSMHRIRINEIEADQNAHVSIDDNLIYITGIDTIAIDSLVWMYKNVPDIEQSKLTLASHNNQESYQLMIEYMRGKIQNGEIKLEEVNGWLMKKYKNEKQ